MARDDALTLAVRRGLNFCVEYGLDGTDTLYVSGLVGTSHHDVTGQTPEEINALKARIVQEVADRFRKMATR